MKKRIKNPRKLSLLKVLNSIAASNRLNALASERSAQANKQNAEALKLIAKTYNRVNPERENVPFWKFWKKKYEHHHVAAYTIIVLTLAGIGIGWNNEVMTSRISEFQAKKEEKIKLQFQINKGVMNFRALVINQNILCKIRARAPEELQAERLDSIKDVAALNTSARNIYGPEVSMKLSEITGSVYHIKDVCKLNGNVFDEKEEERYHEMTALINESIDKDDKQINSLIKKRHQFQLPFEKI